MCPKTIKTLLLHSLFNDSHRALNACPWIRQRGCSWFIHSSNTVRKAGEHTPASYSIIKHLLILHTPTNTLWCSLVTRWKGHTYLALTHWFTMITKPVSLWGGTVWQKHTEAVSLVHEGYCVQRGRLPLGSEVKHWSLFWRDKVNQKKKKKKLTVLIQ